MGKKSVPATIRRDMWTPLCVLNFPNPYQGLHAFARLREFRERHETEWPIEDFTVTKGPNFGSLLGRKERTFKLMDQKANSIADMAAVLAIQARPPESWLVKKMERLVDTKEWYLPQEGETRDKKVIQPSWPRAKRGRNSRIGHRVFEFQGKIDGTSIWWADPSDAEYAETWPVEVVHHNLDIVRGHPRWPPTSQNVPEAMDDDVPQSKELAKQRPDRFDQDTVTELSGSKSKVQSEIERIRLLKEKIKDAKRRMVTVERSYQRLPRLGLESNTEQAQDNNLV